MDTLIVPAAVAVIGIVLFVAGSAKLRPRLRHLGVGAVMVAGTFLFVASTPFREILTASAPLVAIIIAVLSLTESRRLRQDSIERECRDRKQQLIDEVVEWLTELEGRIFPKPGPIASGTEDALRRIGRSRNIHPKVWLHLEDTEGILEEMHALYEGTKKAEYYRKLTSQLDPGLSSSMQAIIGKLTRRRQLHAEHTERGSAEQHKEASALAENAGAIRASVLEATDKAIELKVRLVQVP